MKFGLGYDIHPSHILWYYRGYVFCAACASASNGRNTLNSLLVGPCDRGYRDGAIQHSRLNLLDRFAADKLPAGVKRWPERPLHCPPTVQTYMPGEPQHADFLRKLAGWRRTHQAQAMQAHTDWTANEQEQEPEV